MKYSWKAAETDQAVNIWEPMVNVIELWSTASHILPALPPLQQIGCQAKRNPLQGSVLTSLPDNPEPITPTWAPSSSFQPFYGHSLMNVDIPYD